MKKSREIVLLITSSIALSACDQKPASTRVPLTGVSPTPTATPGRAGGGYGIGYYGGYGFSSSTGTSSGESSTVSRGGFGAHGSSGAS